MARTLMQNVKFVQALAPDADRYNTGPAGDVINMQDYSECVFVIHEGAGATGTATITVESCDDVTPTTATAIAFEYKAVTSTDVEGAWTASASGGFGTTAGANHIYLVRVLAEDLSGSDKYVRINTAESDNDPMDAGILAILSGARYPSDGMRTAIV